MKTLRKDTDLKQIQTLVQGTNTRLKYSQNELEMLKKKHLAAFYRVMQTCLKIGGNSYHRVEFKNGIYDTTGGAQL